MRDSQTLELIGRADDLINIGGVKIHPATLEDQLRPSITARDFCITALVDAEKYTQVCIALVLDPPTTLQDIMNRVRDRIPPLMGEVGFISVDQIPRTPTGKAQRNKLNTLILKARRTNSVSSKAKRSSSSLS
jgi:acyl-coenzyme A synthetase/AMP-(fatty) acid ligase